MSAIRVCALTGWCVMTAWAAAASAADPAFTTDDQPGSFTILAGEDVVMRYVYSDDAIPRPYFCDVHTPGGIQVTRNHPPAEGDPQDHATYHPGIWLAFGDLSGADCWRGKAEVEHVEFVERPSDSNGKLTFAVRNRYWNSAHDEPLCDEVCRYTLSRTNGEYVLSIDSRFSSESGFFFGDQEEMGLGVRLATPLIEKQHNGGLVTDSEFRTTARAVWGRAGDWCDYSGAVDRKPCGVTLLSAPDNVRKPWWHVRDYGLLTANAFGQKAFTGGEASRIDVAAGEEFRMNYEIVIHDGRPGAGYDPRQAFDRFLMERHAAE